LPSSSIGNPTAQNGIVIENVSGNYPVVGVFFECPDVGSIQITPATLSVQPNNPSPLMASAFGSDGLLLESSAFNFAWSSNNGTVVTVPSSGTSLREGSSNFVTGQTTGEGQTAEVLVNESISEDSGSSSITVDVPRTDVFLGPGDYSLPGKTELQAAVTYTINGVQLPFVPLGADFFTYAVRVCNVPLGKQFTLDYSINQYLSPIDPFYFGSYNAVTAGNPPSSSANDETNLPATYPSGSFTLQASCGQSGCWAPSAAQLQATSCVTIPGVND
jgi:hypothetical protein